MSNKSTSITIRLNNGEITQGIEALRAFCTAILNPPITVVDESLVIGFIDGMATTNNQTIESWRNHWKLYKQSANGGRNAID